MVFGLFRDIQKRLSEASEEERECMERCRGHLLRETAKYAAVGAGVSGAVAAVLSLRNPALPLVRTVLLCGGLVSVPAGIYGALSGTEQCYRWILELPPSLSLRIEAAKALLDWNPSARDLYLEAKLRESSSGSNPPKE